MVSVMTAKEEAMMIYKVGAALIWMITARQHFVGRKMVGRRPQKMGFYWNF